MQNALQREYIQQKEVEYYYESHSTLEDVMTEGTLHSELVTYLMAVLKWQFRERVCGLYQNLGVIQSSDVDHYLLAPDICVFKGTPPQTLTSWRIGKTGPAPQVIFEIASPETWRKDMDEKPQLYAQMGIKEYILYDPVTPPIMKLGGRRVVGWRLNTARNRMRPMKLNETGWLWSQQLESFLVPDGALLRLHDTHGQQRLTGEETEAQARQLAEQRAHLFAHEKRLADQRAHMMEQQNHTLAHEKWLSDQRAQTFQQRASMMEQQNRTLEQEKRRIEHEKLLSDQRAQALEQMLRALGINPDA